MRGWLISDYLGEENKTSFQSLLEIFQELMMQSGGDVATALSWLTQLDQMYHLTNDDYTLADFIEELKEKGFIDENVHGTGNFRTTRKLNVSIRKKAFEDYFGEIKKTSSGRQNNRFTGKDYDNSYDLTKYTIRYSIVNIES